MKLIKKISQNRRDFVGEYQCEACGFTERYTGYDDRNFHDNITPGWFCSKCGETSKSLGIKNDVQTKYPEGFQV